MWVVSQNKKTTMKCTKFKVTKNIGGGAGKKYGITGENMPGISGGEMFTYFATEEEAYRELENLNRAIVSGEKLYYFR